MVWLSSSRTPPGHCSVALMFRFPLYNPFVGWMYSQCTASSSLENAAPSPQGPTCHMGQFSAPGADGVFGAASGAMGAALFGWPTIAGSLVLLACIAGFTAFGTVLVERLFKYGTLFLYLVYALFVFFIFARFGDRIAAGFAAASGCTR